jgi:hypothetical protein
MFCVAGDMEVKMNFKKLLEISLLSIFLSTISSYSFAAIDYKCERTKLMLHNWNSTNYAKKLMPEVLHFRIISGKNELITSVFGKDKPFRVSDDIAQRWLENNVRNMRVILDMTKLKSQGTVKWGGRHAHNKFRQVQLSSYKCKKL